MPKCPKDRWFTLMSFGLVAWLFLAYYLYDFRETYQEYLLLNEEIIGFSALIDVTYSMPFTFSCILVLYMAVNLGYTFTKIVRQESWSFCEWVTILSPFVIYLLLYLGFRKYELL